MSIEKCKKLIIEMIEQINDIEALNKIYTVVKTLMSQQGQSLLFLCQFMYEIPDCFFT